jgi:NAD(P)-dependent dehydrogenase (short-subunit alcohol dehydrogenase family)
MRPALDARRPIGHIGDPEDVANGVLYLASDEAKLVTGSSLVPGIIIEGSLVDLGFGPHEGLGVVIVGGCNLESQESSRSI